MVKYRYGYTGASLEHWRDVAADERRKCFSIEEHSTRAVARAHKKRTYPSPKVKIIQLTLDYYPIKFVS